MAKREEKSLSFGCIRELNKIDQNFMPEADPPLVENKIDKI
jgi:hypothetical protein